MSALGSMSLQVPEAHPTYTRRTVWLHHRLGDATLLSSRFDVQVANVPLAAAIAARRSATATDEGEEVAGDGFQFKGEPVGEGEKALQVSDGWIRYRYSLYPRYYVEMTQGLESYRKRFSSKSQYNLRRQRRIYCEQLGVEDPLTVARSPEEVAAFYDAARSISQRTYQERLLDAGLPNNDDFRQRMMAGAAAGLVRGYLLRGKEHPMAFIYCQVEGDDVVCKYVGYDPSISKLSPGTTLLLLALEDLLAEGKFRYFDFEEGHADYKKQFSTGSVTCGSLLVLHKTARNLAIVWLHGFVTRLSRRIGDLLDRWGVKQRLRRFLRRSA